MDLNKSIINEIINQYSDIYNIHINKTNNVTLSGINSNMIKYELYRYFEENELLSLSIDKFFKMIKRCLEYYYSETGNEIFCYMDPSTIRDFNELNSQINIAFSTDTKAYNIYSDILRLERKYWNVYSLDIHGKFTKFYPQKI